MLHGVKSRYEIGHDTGLKEPEIKPARQDLWNFRWEHAQARIAARRGDQAEAQRHVAAAKSILDKGTIPEQAQFFPYGTEGSPTLADELASLTRRYSDGLFLRA